MSDLIQDIDLKMDDSSDARWPVAARSLLVAARERLADATCPRRSGAQLTMVSSSNRIEGHDDPHLE
jgi:hypothetical protein